MSQCPKCGITPSITRVSDFKVVTCGMINGAQWFSHPLAGCPMAKEEMPADKRLADEFDEMRIALFNYCMQLDQDDELWDVYGLVMKLEARILGLADRIEKKQELRR